VVKRLLGRLGIAAVLAFVLTLVLTTGSSAVSPSRQVVMGDDCDPATFNAVIGPGTCVKNGSTTFSEFVSQLIAQGRAPAWRFAPDQLSLAAGGTVKAINIGGETHTFTEVANFGGGCIDFLNGLLGLTPVPECAGFPGGVFGATAVPAGGTLTATLAPGVHRFECLIHPWMRTTVEVS
jgi:plastocyanin